MVLGVGDLMAEREQMRRQYQIARTTIGGAGNNPFKWAPTQRLALDLLLAEGHGFLSGPGALQASFQDIKKHLLATFSGLHQSLRAAVDSFSPAAIEQATRSNKSFFKSGATLQWEEVQRRYLDLSNQVDGQADGPLNAVFVQAYDAKVADLESRVS
jgi:type VI secretion system FHA domain protein